MDALMDTPKMMRLFTLFLLTTVCHAHMEDENDGPAPDVDPIATNPDVAEALFEGDFTRAFELELDGLAPGQSHLAELLLAQRAAGPWPRLLARRLVLEVAASGAGSFDAIRFGGAMAACPEFGLDALVARARAAQGVVQQMDVLEAAQRCMDAAGLAAAAQAAANSTASASAQTKTGWRALHFAAAAGNTGAVLDLVGHRGADVNATTHKRQTALHLAVAGGHTKAAKALMGLGADRARKDLAKRTAIAYAQGAPSPSACIALLKALRYPKKKRKRKCGKPHATPAGAGKPPFPPYEGYENLFVEAYGRGSSSHRPGPGQAGGNPTCSKAEAWRNPGQCGLDPGRRWRLPRACDIDVVNLGLELAKGSAATFFIKDHVLRSRPVVLTRGMAVQANTAKLHERFQVRVCDRSKLWGRK